MEYFVAAVRARPDLAHIPPAARALAVKLVTETDLLRLEVIARVHARGLPPEIDWSDLLQELAAIDQLFADDELN
jgi:hypothetical protein